MKANKLEVVAVGGKLRESQTSGLWQAHVALLLILVGTILTGFASDFAP